MDPHTRFALFVAGGERCTWCGEPITYKEMELDHVIPKSLAGKALLEALELHGLPEDYDLDDLSNLVPSCRACNGSKHKRVPPSAPIITMILESARTRANIVRRSAATRLRTAEVDRAVAVLERAAYDSGDDEVQSALHSAIAKILAARDQTPDSEIIDVAIHPAVALLWDPSVRWQLVESLGPTTAVVSDGRRSGIVGTHISFECPHCGSNGPWSGVRCMTCGQVSDPWD